MGRVEMDAENTCWIELRHVEWRTWTLTKNERCDDKRQCTVNKATSYDKTDRWARDAPTSARTPVFPPTEARRRPRFHNYHCPPYRYTAIPDDGTTLKSRAIE
ncbi:unnamed protein product [Angiostrongylus costaricensis]|uniref:Uncharacterized protein n=1 Tax=Angiostrongylus costaricensis TaxID=334426 RepID=A0A0R3PVK9_ANGCS|nr:unnamed protein product [Angiostrongylus costaricensis]